MPEKKDIERKTKHFYEEGYWKGEGRSILDLRRMVVIYSIIAFENSPIPNFISPIGTDEYEGWWFSWEDRSPHSMVIETDGDSLTIYAFKDSDFVFYHDLYFPDSDPEKRDSAGKELTMERLHVAIADAKKWLEENQERLHADHGEGRNQNILNGLFWWA